MHFANPKFLYLFILIPLYLVWYYYCRKEKSGIEVSVFNDLVKAMSDKGRFRRYFGYFRLVLIVVMIGFFCLALARPQGDHQKEDVSKKGIDIIISIDVSDSMLAEDLRPNRIEAAKKALEKFVDNLQNDRLGVVVFSGQAFTQSPLTFDYNVLQEYIDNISTDSINKRAVGMSGTAIGDAILSALNRFKNSEDRTKVLVLITDGDANTGVDPKIAAQKAVQEDVKIYTVGVGQEGGAPIPVMDRLGRKTYAKNADGSRFMATFNEDALKDIAKTAKGSYFRVADNDGFDKVLAEINSLEKREITINTTVEYTENFYPYLLGLAFIFLLYFVDEVFFKELF